MSRQIRSIAIPPLGSHNGGLDWLRVKQMVEQELSTVECDVNLYEPSDAIVERMKNGACKTHTGQSHAFVDVRRYE